MMESIPWVVLPVQGAVLLALNFRGNGKDGEVSIETEGNPRVVVPTRNHSMVLGREAFQVSLREIDDVSVEQRLTWPSDVRVILATAEIGWWLAPEEWEKQMDRWRTARRWEVSAVVALRLRLA